MDQKKGVFSPCKNLDSMSMIKCLQALLGACPTIKFHSVSMDKKHHGFKVFFTEPDYSSVLRKNMIFSSDGQPVWIYPLTTYLCISNVDHRKSPLFERDLRISIEKTFGRVLSVLKTNSGNQSKTWRIEIDVPEFKGLEVFKGKFTGMNLLIPNRNESVVLEFWCRECEEHKHFQHECLTRENTASNRTSEENDVDDNEQNFILSESSPSDQSSEGKSKSKTESENACDLLKQQACSSLVQNPERKPEPKNIAQVIGTEEATSFGKEKEKHTQNNATVNEGASTGSNFLTVKDIKRENEEIIQQDNYLENLLSGIRDNNFHSKDTTTRKNESDDEIQVIESLSNASNSSVRVRSGSYEEESKSPDAKATHFPNFTFPSIAGPSYESPSAVLPSPRGAEVTTALSERLQDCINEVCTTIGVLDRKKLDAFLIHVKKKSNPIRVALNYTANTKGVKEQLQGILHMYYNTPQTGTKEDIQFIKWLNGLVERYDGSIPKKRKRSAKTDDEPPTKK